MKLIRWLAALAATGTVVVIAAFMLLPDLRWRGALLLEKAQGKYPEATWPEFVRLLRPGSGFWLVDLNRHATMYAFVSNPFTKGVMPRRAIASSQRTAQGVMMQTVPAARGQHCSGASHCVQSRVGRHFAR